MSGAAILDYCLTFGLAFALAACLTPLVRRFAIAKGHVAAPRENRWHKRQTALLGGVAIFLAVNIGWAVMILRSGSYASSVLVLPIVVCGAAMFGLGLADDLKQMAPQHKLAGQLVITSALVFFGFRLGWTQFATLNLLLTILWLVGITNAFNLLDNMDGLAAGIAFLGAAFLAVSLFQAPPFPLRGQALLLCLSYGGAVLGFLVYNFNPAKIFMGDAGSLYLGFLMASLTVAGVSPRAGEGGALHLISVIAVPVMILFVPILDPTFVSFMRKLFHRKISEGGKDHSSHRMVAIGLTERKAVVVLYAFAAASGGVAVALRYVGLGPGILLIGLYLLSVVFFWIYLGKVKVYPERSILADIDSRGFTPIVVNFTYRKGILTVLLDAGMITIAYYSAYLLRFEGQIGADLEIFLRSLPILLAAQIGSFYVFGVYQSVWETVGLRDLIIFLKSITAGSVATMLFLLFVYRFESVSRAVFVIYWVIFFVMVSLSRLSFRILDEVVKSRKQDGDPVVIYGAGVGGQMVIKEIESNPDLNLSIAGFVDDNGMLRGKRVKGYKVLGTIEDLGTIVSRHEVKEMIIAFKGMDPEKRKALEDVCERMDPRIRIRQMRLVIS